MTTATKPYLILLIIGLTFTSALVISHSVHADDAQPAIDPDDPTAIWACYPDTDDDGNPIQSCGFGHYTQQCSFDNTTRTDSCGQVFTPDPPSSAELFAPIIQDLLSKASLSLSATIQKGMLSWSYSPIATSSPTMQDLVDTNGPYPFSELLSSATLTLDIYKGTMGSSTLMYSQDVSSSTSGSFPFTFDTTSPYYMALSATYPDGTYPPGQGPLDHCPSNSGDFCIVPTYPLSSFQNAMTGGYDLIAQSSEALGNYIPAAYGILDLTIPEVPPAAPPVSNVLFIPGTLTSRLYMKNANGTERDLWEPHSDLDVGPLAMDGNGKSLNTIYTRDLISQLYSDDPIYGSAAKAALGAGTNVYGPFESFMNSLVTNGTLKEWKAYPYDWRYDVSDIVQNGTLVSTATGTPSHVYLQDVIQELASTSPTGKVTIVAHSNGGLIAKALAIDLQKKGELGLLDHIVMVGTPQFGTPKSLLDMLHGSEFTQVGGLLMYSGSVRAAEETMPGPYDLLPSAAYFSQVTTPVATFDTNQPAAKYQKVFGSSIDSFSKLADFVEDTFHIDGLVGLPGSTRTPIALSKTLVQKAMTTHEALDAWTPPAGLLVTAIAGWGQLTPYQIAYSGTSGLNCDRTSFFVPVACSLQPQLQDSVLSTENGDDTVVDGSAIGSGASDTLYMDAKQYETDTKKHIGHGSLLNSVPIQSQLTDILQNNQKMEPYVSATIPSEPQSSYTVVSAHSPVNILATDPDGNQTGIVTIPGLSGLNFEKEDIPGSSIQVVDDEKYLYLPQDEKYVIGVKGYDSGATTIQIGTVSTTGVATTTQTFSDIPTTASTTATFSVDAYAVAPSTISVDVDGDGSTTPITANEATSSAASSDENYRSSLFTLRALLGSHRLGPILKALLYKSFRDFAAQKNPNSLVYLMFQALISAESGVKLAFPPIQQFGSLFHALGM
jgi:pimeloyl-ACP methyl ester carboxylesterase